jgi:hypothetical protein
MSHNTMGRSDSSFPQSRVLKEEQLACYQQQHRRAAQAGMGPRASCVLNVQGRQP